jgi:hypothetical protein
MAVFLPARELFVPGGEQCANQGKAGTAKQVKQRHSGAKKTSRDSDGDLDGRGLGDFQQG